MKCLKLSNLLWMPLMMFFTITVLIMISNLYTYINCNMKENITSKSATKKNWQW